MSGAPAIFDGELAAFAGLVGRDPLAEAIPLADLCESARLAEALERYRSVLGGTHGRAAASLWSQYLLGRLIVPTTALIVAGGLTPGATRTAITVALCAETGLPLRFAAPLECSAEPGHDLAAFTGAVLSPLLADFARATGLSRSLLWENAARPFTWTLGILARSRRAECEGCEGMLRHVEGAAGRCPQAFRASVRRTCCLRHHLPGFAKCEGLCPLVEPARRERAAR